MKNSVHTLGGLKASGYQPKSVKEELRQNLIEKLRSKETIFPGIYGFDDTVLPDIERAVLSRHNILLLGLRGQAKTRIARMLTGLLDEYVPVVAGSELNDDPLAPISRYAKELIAEKGDDTPITWLHRDERYVEKLATPDVSIADFVGDVDPIQTANLRLPYSAERVIHVDLLPGAHRCLSGGTRGVECRSASCESVGSTAARRTARQSPARRRSSWWASTAPRR